MLKWLDMAKKKAEKPFDFEAFVNEAIGQAILAIATGNFRSTLFGYMQSLNSMAYRRGYEQCQKDQAKKKRPRR